MDWGPPSVTVSIGDEVRLLCRHNGSNPNITWWHILQGNSTWPPMMELSSPGPKGELVIQQVTKSHRGMYRCQVKEGQKVQRSCGTYLRVRGECTAPHSWGHTSACAVSAHHSTAGAAGFLTCDGGWGGGGRGGGWRGVGGWSQCLSSCISGILTPRLTHGG